ncbi:b149.12 [miniopterid betaherpesvirus 1]|uniref:B149.12 n=1 Tax=miniopterid betaherpesvirus 1 TaxID=3070189 RepID=I3VQE8_9BETA|nr:b149.12 [miniopterid betaherpesvirus 1]AFK83992.1 b149.12 [miniopterid betaherpesvirus 1]
MNFQIHLVGVALSIYVIHATEYENQCAHEETKRYEYNSTILLVCGTGRLGYVYVCYTGTRYETKNTLNIGDFSFIPLNDDTVGYGRFNYTVVGWYECIENAKCINKRIIIGSRMVVSTYRRYQGMDTFMCDNPYPNIVDLWMFADGDNVTDRCRRHDNGSISYATSRINTAVCAAHLPCMNKSYYDLTYSMHENTYNLTMNEDDEHLNCSRDTIGTTAMQAINDESGGNFSHHLYNIMEPWDKLEKSWLCSWCVTVSENDVSISDAVMQRDNKQCPITERSNPETETSIADAVTSSGKTVQTLNYMTIFVICLLTYNLNDMQLV